MTNCNYNSIRQLGVMFVGMLEVSLNCVEGMLGVVEGILGVVGGMQGFVKSMLGVVGGMLGVVGGMLEIQFINCFMRSGSDWLRTLVSVKYRNYNNLVSSKSTTQLSIG